MRKIFFNDAFFIECLLIWFIFQSVLSSSLLKYSSYESIISITQSINNVARIIMIFLGMYLLMKNKIKKDSLVPLCIYGIIVVISKVYNDSYQFLDGLFLAFVFPNSFKREKILKIFFYTVLLSCCLVVILYFAGIFPYYSVKRSDGKQRMFLGFAHPNSLGYYIMILCFLWILKIKGEIKYIHIFTLMAASYFVYLYPNSFSSAISILLLSLYHLINKMYLFLFRKNVTRNHLFKYGTLILVPTIIVLIYWMVANATSSTLAIETLSTFYARFRLGSRAIEQYGIHLFGTRDMQFVNTATKFFINRTLKYFTVDCFYIQILVKYGIVPSICFAIYYMACIKACINAKDTGTLVILVIMAIYSINESMLLAVPTSFIFIISGNYLFNYKQKKYPGVLHPPKTVSTSEIIHNRI